MKPIFPDAGQADWQSLQARSGGPAPHQRVELASRGSRYHGERALALLAGRDGNEFANLITEPEMKDNAASVKATAYSRYCTLTQLRGQTESEDYHEVRARSLEDASLSPA
ncbi:hypothetical protein BaRGS_00006506 [Batillaria attramentaria]|uniref:Uncharacterized protein n=1 Tax=Batillaria attramentaria TaxID=370345 RepID=A0ABD0LRS1_9CAEN